MSSDTTLPGSFAAGEFFVPGTCFVPHPHATASEAGVEEPGSAVRDPAMREFYLNAALADIPRLLGAIDRNPFHPTYGCLDRQYWHYRTSSFPSQMYQEGVLPLALIYATKLPGNRWFLDPRVKELAVAALRFTVGSSHKDSTCDDYYPFERALGAAVFSLSAAAEAYRLLELHDADLLSWFERRAQWLIDHDESGRLANHQALAALGLLRVGRITDDPTFRAAAETRLGRLLEWQSGEGWFEEYGGADPGYQTVTIDCLAKIRKLTGNAELDEPIRRAVAFARWFSHPDGSYGGEYGSRGTYHYYPHGMELLAADNLDAADLADGFLRSLATGRQANFGDDRMYAHRLGNQIEAYVDWSPTRPAASDPASGGEAVRYFSEAGLFVRHTTSTHTVISSARGGVLKHFGHDGDPITDAGLVVQTQDGRVAVSQMHDRDQPVERSEDRLTVGRPLCWNRFETATPIKQALFHAGMALCGRWFRTPVRRLLQRRLISERRRCPMRLTRSVEFLRTDATVDGAAMRISDMIELMDPKVRVQRMAFGTDHQAAYVAASNVYQDGVLEPWTNLQPYVDRLNAERRVTIVRQF